MGFLKKYYYVYVLVLAVAFAAAWFTADRITAVDAAMQDSSTPVVIIDPGHGGEDGGAISCTGVQESQLNLEISLRLNDLCHLMGISTQMVRTQDKAVYSQGCSTISEKKVSDLKNRVALVNDTPGALLVSIHQNMFSDPKYSGAQVFYAGTEGSRQLAESIQSLLCVHVDPDNHRECKPASAVYLMEHIHCTGVLIECGFLSNSDEEQLLRTPEYQKKLACAICAGLYPYITEENGNNEV